MDVLSQMLAETAGKPHQKKPASPPTTTPAPCPVCGSPLYWRQLSVGPLSCAVCHEPERPKQWATVVMVDGRYQWARAEDERERAARLRAGEEPVPEVEGPDHSPDGIPLTQPEFDRWWAENARRSEALMELMERRAAAAERDRAAERAKAKQDKGAKLW